MKPKQKREVVNFVTTEDSDDLIVSFACATDEIGEVMSLTLIRTPKYESLLPADERGVSVAHELDNDDDDGDRLHRIRLAVPITTITTTRRQYELDMSRVDDAEVETARGVLERMNFDRCFTLELR